MVRLKLGEPEGMMRKSVGLIIYGYGVAGVAACAIKPHVSWDAWWICPAILLIGSLMVGFDRRE